MISVEHLCKSYSGSKSSSFFSAQKVPALNDVSFMLSGGKTLIVSGTKNSGKTSLLKILSAIIKPDSGSINVLGSDLKKSANDIRRQSVYLTNNQPFFDYLNCKEQLSYFALLKGIRPGASNPAINELLKKWNLNPRKPVSKLSMEEKMLLGLAQVQLIRPKLILLDEPAFGLDIFTAKPIFEMINEAKKEGIGIVYASGNLSNIEMFGDDIIFLHQGKMVYQSPLQTFLQGFDNSADKGFIHVISEAEKSTQ